MERELNDRLDGFSDLSGVFGIDSGKRNAPTDTQELVGKDVASLIEMGDPGVVQALPPGFSSLGRAKSEEDDVCVRVVPKLRCGPPHVATQALNASRV